MASLLEIKKQITGVKNTRKITKAMQLVAASKMRQFQRRALNARDYVTSLIKILERNITEGTDSLYTEVRESGKTLFVIYTSDKGLCGSLNNKLLKALFDSKRWKETPADKRMLITIGKKSYTFAKNNKIPVDKDFVAIPEQLTHFDAIKVVDSIIGVWKKEKVKEVLFIAPHYKNSFTTYPVVKQFLPFSKDTLKTNIGKEKAQEIDETQEMGNKFMMYSPDKEAVLEEIYEQVVHGMFIQAFLELKAAEYSSRMIAMQNATDAADKLSGELKLKFNKARQQAITQEIAELISAKMALAEEE
jgi:F-type H+-transporting ATPase subunit gamma